jgi:hypothetical protein
MMLMQEEISYTNLVGVLSYMLKTLSDAHDLSFIIKRDNAGWEVHSLNSTNILEAPHLEEEVNLLQSGWIYSNKQLRPALLELVEKDEQVPHSPLLPGLCSPFPDEEERHCYPVPMGDEEHQA